MGNQHSKPTVLTFAAGAAAGAAAAVLLTRAGSLAQRQRAPQAGKGAEGGRGEIATAGEAVGPNCVIVQVEQLKAFTRDVFVHCGCDADAAKEAADVLLSADLRGIYSHGIARLHAYFEMLQAGVINARPKVRIVRETESTATVDGDNGLGLIVGPAANRIAIAKAKKSGSGWVSVRNTHHYGIAGYYALAAVRQASPMIGISMTTASNVVTPLWGRQRMLGTNPIAVAFPAGEEKPVVVDMASSVVPWGKVEEAARVGATLPEGWAVDAQGAPAVDPDKVLREGALLPLGGDRAHSGHKGYCLAAMVDILCAVLSGGRWGPTVSGFMTHAAVTGSAPPGDADTAAAAAAAAAADQGDGKFALSSAAGAGASASASAATSEGEGEGEGEGEDAGISHPGGVALGIGHFFGAMRVDAFRDDSQFRQTMDTWIRTFRSSAPVRPERPVLVPGDPEWELEEKQAEGGVPVKASVVADLVDIEQRTGISIPFDYSCLEMSSVKRVQATA